VCLCTPKSCTSECGGPTKCGPLQECQNGICTCNTPPAPGAGPVPCTEDCPCPKKAVQDCSAGACVCKKDTCDTSNPAYCPCPAGKACVPDPTLPGTGTCACLPAPACNDAAGCGCPKPLQCDSQTGSCQCPAGACGATGCLPCPEGYVCNADHQCVSGGGPGGICPGGMKSFGGGPCVGPNVFNCLKLTNAGYQQKTCGPNDVGGSCGSCADGASGPLDCVFGSCRPQPTCDPGCADSAVCLCVGSGDPPLECTKEGPLPPAGKCFQRCGQNTDCQAGYLCLASPFGCDQGSPGVCMKPTEWASLQPDTLNNQPPPQFVCGFNEPGKNPWVGCPEGYAKRKVDSCGRVLTNPLDGLGKQLVALEICCQQKHKLNADGTVVALGGPNPGEPCCPPPTSYWEPSIGAQVGTAGAECSKWPALTAATAWLGTATCPVV